MTNGERIRAMTDKELDSFILKCQIDAIKTFTKDIVVLSRQAIKRNEDFQNRLEWFKQEVDDA